MVGGREWDTLEFAAVEAEEEGIVLKNIVAEEEGIVEDRVAVAAVGESGRS
jgi:hypothetical protein